MTITARCPECGSTRIEEYRMPYGPMWCLDCGFCVEEKYAKPNPFVVREDEDQAFPRRAEPDRPMLGEQMAAWMEMERKKKKWKQ
jgi:transcription initiation factor TFIIIB Brf1 subunit/transcription initiation factor TFIIB